MKLLLMSEKTLKDVAKTVHFSIFLVCFFVFNFSRVFLIVIQVASFTDFLKNNKNN